MWCSLKEKLAKYNYNYMSLATEQIMGYGLVSSNNTL